MASPAINRVEIRSKLKARREPYWHRIEAGQFLGFRKMTSESPGSWVARSRDPATGKHRHTALGEFTEHPPSARYDLAKRAAEAWFKHLGLGGTTMVLTVKEAAAAYVKHIREVSGDKPASDAEARFRRWVDSDPALASIALPKLTRLHLEKWRKALAKKPAQINRDARETPIVRPRAASSVNRDMAPLRAALNLAHAAGHATSDMAWREALKPIKNADGRREVYLDRGQRKKLIENAPPDIAVFLRGLSQLPLRPGALAALRVASLDPRLGVLTIGRDKAGRDRRIKLPTSTAEWLTERCKDRPSTAPMFTRADGKAWTKDMWKVPIKEAALAAELPPVTTAYALRHSTITDLVAAGLDLLTVAQLSGTSVLMIEKHYGHLRADRAAKALAGLIL